MEMRKKTFIFPSHVGISGVLRHGASATIGSYRNTQEYARRTDPIAGIYMRQGAWRDQKREALQAGSRRLGLEMQ